MPTEKPQNEEGFLARALDVNERIARAAAMGVPAFVRRAQAMERAVERLYKEVEEERLERLRTLLPLARSLVAAEKSGAPLAPETRRVITLLKNHPDYGRRTAPPPRRPHRCERLLTARVRRFNRRWLAFLEKVPIEDVHRLQEKYNRYYPIEREMALRGVRFPFEPVKLLERDDLLERFPPLPVPP